MQRRRHEVLLRDGTRLTEARTEQMVAESLASTGSGNLIPGRKSLSGDGTHSPRLQLRVPRELHDAAAERAREEGTSVSKLVRKALEEYLAT